MNNKIFIIILLSLFLVSFASAKIIIPSQSHPLQVNIWDIDTIPQGQDFTFVWDTSQDGMLLNNTENNCSFFMIKQGSASQTFSNIDASNAPGVYGLYQTVTGGNFSTLGTYNVQIDCYKPTNTSISGNALLQFEVKNQAPISEITPGLSISYGFIFFALLFLIIGLLVLTIIIPGNNKSDEMTGYIIAVNNLKYLKYLCFGFAYALMILFAYFNWMFLLTYLEFAFLTSLAQYSFYILAYGALPFYILYVYFIIANWIRDSNIAEMLERGLSTDGQ